MPWFIPVLGPIGGPLLVASSTAVLVFVWELTLASRLIATGFTAAAIAAEPASTEPRIPLATRPA